ncbi:hypothetical protein BKA67DRAFT_535206 [Truncatella angustata]|uniref:Uncharacterized protein n=1 Tax=Truncatella angustata TaxID=152316 RepID=A0A9P8UKX1_9PEZI|nr:uncharacterized protein BKA67DRAFT_535206 [Truncatella angustata]KAH6653857.1 hypothetical protein BKA67DRAFT_535206 [Truncatella angustata]KAH8193766.1 hypothetical protein TruAng_012067 [Truncatella angustata]
MHNERIHDAATSNVLAWSRQSVHTQHDPDEEVSAEADEPPDDSTFRRTVVRKYSDRPTPSLLTRALHHQSDEEEEVLDFISLPLRRRSMNSNVSFASTTDLTCDTGLTSPARTSTPSPPPPVIRLGKLNVGLFNSRPKPVNGSTIVVDHDTTPTKKVIEAPAANRTKDPAVEALAKKRCISFACGPKPEAKKPAVSPQASLPKLAVDSGNPPPRKTCIQFACPSKPARDEKVNKDAESTSREGSPATIRKHRSPSIGRSPRSLTPRRRPSKSPAAGRCKKYLSADTVDLRGESSRFHEFASDEPQEDDWIRQQLPVATQRLTINDTLRKENEIRKLGREAEEEALQEEFEDDEVIQDDEENQDDEDVEEDEIDDVEDDESGYGSDDDFSDGYNTDNEGGFADSDGDDDADELDLWTHGHAAMLQISGATPIARRPSLAGDRSESSSSEAPAPRRRSTGEKTRRIKIRPGTPELPDSTDFVCGTLDEDRPLEDAYLSCIAQKRREKMHLIPQDIDPSFPTSEPEDEEDDAVRESDEHVMIHGELEDLHHEDRADRRRKRSNNNSPKRFHSPPPKRHHSPAPKARGRSPPPRRLFDRHSPRRLVSPPPPGRVIKSPPASLTQAVVRRAVAFQTLAGKPEITHTKSLPRPLALFPNRYKGQRSRLAAYTGAQGHVRGAIDIVKGLEHKRQRRREKYIQKHCNRARKGQAAGKRPEPGKGAQRMRELGLHIAGKPTIHVLSI